MWLTDWDSIDISTFQLGDDRSRTCREALLVSRSEYKASKKLLYMNKKALPKTAAKQKPKAPTEIKRPLQENKTQKYLQSTFDI